MISIIRCDDRLIHGQCIFRVLNDHKIKRILLIDEVTATNCTLKNIYKLAAPKDVETQILTVKESMDAVAASVQDEVNTLILFKYPGVAITLFQTISDLKKEVNIGPMSNRAGTQKITMFSHLTKDEIQDLEVLSELGVRVYFQQVESERAVEWSKLRQNVIIF